MGWPRLSWERSTTSPRPPGSSANTAPHLPRGRRRASSSMPSASSGVRSRFKELMSQAVARTLSGRDVVSLSGGIDSPAVASYAAPIHLQMSGHPIGALSAFFPAYPDVDESRYIKVVCKHLEIPLHS